MSVPLTKPSRELPLLLAGCAACGVLLLGWAVYHWYYQTPRELPDPNQSAAMFAGPYQMNMLLLRFQRPVDAQGQKLTHRAMLVATGALLLLLPITVRRLAARPRQSLIGGLRLALVGAVGYFVSLAFPVWPGTTGVLLGLGLAAILAVLGYRLLGKWSNRLLGGAVLLVLAATQLPGLGLKLDQSFRPWATVEVIEAHYTLVLSPGDRLAAGRQLFDDIAPGYGALIPLLTATYQRVVGPLSLGGYLRLIEVCQAAYLLAFVVGYHRQARRRWLVALVPVVFVMLHLHFYQPAFYYGAPNHTAIRYLAVPLLCLSFFGVRNLSVWRAALLLGGAVGLALLFCWDIGIALAVGAVVFLFLRHYLQAPRRAWWRLPGGAALFGAGVATAFGAYALALFALTGSLPTAAGVREFLYTMKIATSSGHSSGRWTVFDPLAIAIFGHAVFALLYSWHKIINRRGTFRDSLRAAVTTILLVWFAYYANRPDPMYLWSSFGLYGFLLIDVVEVLIFWGGRRLPGWPVLGGAALLATVIGPYFCTEAKAEWGWYRQGWQLALHPPAPDVAVRLSGVYFPRERRSDELAKKVAFIRTLGKDGPVIYFTADTYLVPKLSGVWSALPVAEFWWESVTRRQYDRILVSVRASGAQHIYFDTDDSLTSPAPQPPMPGCREFYRQLRADLAADYEKETEVSGWEQWRHR